MSRSKKGGRAVVQFLELVTSMNPILRSDKRVNTKMVDELLARFEKETAKKVVIDYDILLDKVCESLSLPEAVVEPFLEMYASGMFALANRKFVRMCKHCGTMHSLQQIQECVVRDSAVIKTAIGLVLVNDSEDKNAVKN